MTVSRKPILAATLAALAALIASTAGPATGSDVRAAACTPATNIEAIIDDSGSMSSTDPNRLRVQGMDLVINALSAGTTLGAIEFGSADDFASPPTPAADSVFKPEAVGPNAAAMKSALDQKIQADNGSTDYNAAFSQSDADNPNAAARIFLTDGGHNVGDYNNGHLNHKVPTYVIGFSAAIGDPSNASRLQMIASDTGGHYYPLNDSSQLQSVMNSIETALTCQTPPQTFTDLLSQGQTKAHSVTVGAKTSSLQIALTWTNPQDAFTATGFKIVSHGKTVAVSAARHKKPRKLRIQTTRSATFTLLKVSHLRRGKLTFKVKALTVGSGTPQVTLTTQVSRNH
jgi:hypothetical protein